MSLTYKEQFIKFMVDSGILRFGEFTLKSGRLSPYFINTGNYKTGSQISALGGFYAECIKENNIEGDAIFGPAYKGIPLAVTTAITLYTKYGIDMNYSFDRKEVKDHGEGGMIIGYKFESGDRLIFVDDVITSGKALRESMEKIKGMCSAVVKDMVISKTKPTNTGTSEGTTSDPNGSDPNGTTNSGSSETPGTGDPDPDNGGGNNSGFDTGS